MLTLILIVNQILKKQIEVKYNGNLILYQLVKLYIWAGESSYLEARCLDCWIRWMQIYKGLRHQTPVQEAEVMH